MKSDSVQFYIHRGVWFLAVQHITGVGYIPNISMKMKANHKQFQKILLTRGLLVADSLYTVKVISSRFIDWKLLPPQKQL